MVDQLPRKNFDDFYLSEGMVGTLRDIGYETPTPVQAATIPLVMAGIDLIVMSQTGTGKTAAFAIPIAEMLGDNPGTVEVLILTPTRELARQVSEEFARLAAFKNVDVATIYGGSSYEKQFKALETAQIVVATPGRLLDLANRGRCDLSQLQIFGLDEADEMLSMGFAEEVDAIIEKLPEERQSLLFSATITAEVQSLGKRMLYYPEFITLSTDSVAAEEVTHEWFPVTGVGRARDLLRVLEYEEPESAIVFANTKADTFTVTDFLKRHGVRAEVLNGDLPQRERERTLAALKSGKIDFLVATDVAARGIDISDLSHVINYVVPDNAEVYVHRTGRTGRAGQEGKALSLISPREMATLFGIRKQFGVEMVKRPLPTPKEILEAKKTRHLENLRARMELSSVPYGGAIGLARQLMNGGSADEETVRLLARLIAVADSVSQGDIPDVPTKSDLEAARRAEEVADDDSEAPVESLAAESSDVEEVEEVADVVEAEEPEAAVSAEAPEATPEASSRRRQRRRESGGDRDADSRSKRRKKSGSRSERRKESGSRSERRKESGSRGQRKSRSNGRSRRSNGRQDSASKGGRRTKTEETTQRAAAEASADFETSKMWVNVGKNHFDAPEQIVEMVCFMAGMEPEDVGRVTLENSYSYVEVREDYFYDIINAMNNQDWNGITVSAEPARK